MNIKSQHPLSVIMSILFLASLFVGCSSEDPVEPDLREIKFAATLPYATRVTNNQWEVNDAIGVSVYEDSYSLSPWCFYDNVKLVANKAGIETDFISQDSQKMLVPTSDPTFIIIAYYPYLPENWFWHDYMQVWDQTDRLLAHEISDASQTDCNLNFKHILARLDFVFTPGPKFTLDEVKNGIYTITSILEGGYRIKKDTYRRSGSIQGSFQRGGQHIMSWEISSHNYSKVQNGNSLKITLLLAPTGDEIIDLKGNVKGEEMSCSFPVTLTAGVSQTVNITVRDFKLVVESVTAGSWSTSNFNI